VWEEMDKAVIPIYRARGIIWALGGLRAGGSDHLRRTKNVWHNDRSGPHRPVSRGRRERFQGEVSEKQTAN